MDILEWAKKEVEIAIERERANMESLPTRGAWIEINPKSRSLSTSSLFVLIDFSYLSLSTFHRRLRPATFSVFAS